MQSKPSVSTVSAVRPVYSSAPWLTDTGVPSDRATHIQPGRILRTASHTLSRSRTASGSGRAVAFTPAPETHIAQIPIAHITAKRWKSFACEWASASELKVKAPITDCVLPRNLARSTTQTIGRGSSCGLYQAASTPPAAIRAHSLADTRFHL